jgi:1-pyrroline-4-hydroxy-2-carboxylate deaminase
MDTAIFRGCMPALMTPVDADGRPDNDVLVRTARALIDAGMSGVVYCGSMGEWPLLSDEQRREGVRRLVEAGVPVVVGTGAQSPAAAVAHATHAREVGAKGLMVIPRVLSRGTSVAAQRDHLGRVLAAAPELPAVIYNSPYYGFETGPELFFELRREHANVVGFKEFGGAAALTRAAEHITHADDELLLLVGVDTQVFHGFVRCGAAGAITGVGNCLPAEVLALVALCRRAAAGDLAATRLARELDDALHVLSTFDEGPDLVLYYKHLAVLMGDDAYARPVDPSDALGASQRRFVEAQLRRFQAWWRAWPGSKAGVMAAEAG